MNLHKTQYYGIWLDDNKALIITLDKEKSLILPVFRTNGTSDEVITMGKAIEKSTIGSQYFKDIFSALPESDTLLILGPDQSKLHLKEFLERESGNIKKIVTKVAGHMTTSDIIHSIRNFFFQKKVELS
jgi:stalled ribosome rescue protein Dom34